jgi:type II secretory ATPase GspE/PulE/Tfp pilus assembly ATPase PilB-like protein
MPGVHEENKVEGRNKKVIEKVLDSIKNKDDHVDTIPEFIYEPQGCAACNMTGFKGRVGIYEAITRSEAIEKAILNNPSEREIWKAAEEQEILTMKQDGVLKVLGKVTSISELERVVDIETL